MIVEIGGKVIDWRPLEYRGAKVGNSDCWGCADLNKGPEMALTEKKANDAGEEAAIEEEGTGEDSGVNKGEAEASDSQSDMTIDIGEELVEAAGEYCCCCCCWIAARFLTTIG